MTPRPDPIAAWHRRFTWICTERDVSQNELARRLRACGLPTGVSSVGRWFNGEGLPDGANMILLPSRPVLDCSPGWFLAGLGHPDDHRKANDFEAGVRWATEKMLGQLDRLNGAG